MVDTPWVAIPGLIDADVLLRHIRRRALRRAGLPRLQFHDLRHMAETLMRIGLPVEIEIRFSNIADTIARDFAHPKLPVRG